MSPSKTSVNGFIKLGSQVHLRRPTKAEATPDTTSPTIIIVFGWMGGQLRHVQKYTTVYEELYPSATQIIVTSSPSFFWSSDRTKRKTIAPVVEILEAMGAIPGLPSTIMDPVAATAPRILLHSFSNGGAYSLMTLGKALSARPMPSPDTAPRASCALILDSAPGGGGLTNAVRAFTTHMRSPVKKFFAKIWYGTLYVLTYMVGPMLGRKTSLQKIWEALYGAHLVPWMDKRTPRLYIFSKADDQVPGTDTEIHAQAAKDMGRNVKTLVLDDTPHVDHARTHPEEYWGAVRSLWQQAVTID